MRYSGVLVAATAAASNATCNSVQIFLVCGHGESVPGLQTSITDAICSDVSSSHSGGNKKTCGFQSIAYNANSGAETICQDQYDGIQMLRGNLTAYATACPSSRLVVSGWSQGGALVTDLFAGGGDGLDLTGTCVQPSSPALMPDEFPGPRVAAVVTFGELHHNADMPWNVGNGSAADGVSYISSLLFSSISPSHSVTLCYVSFRAWLTGTVNHNAAIPAHCGYARELESLDGPLPRLLRCRRPAVCTRD